MAFRDFVHARSEGERVRRVDEERVVGDFDFMIVDVGCIRVEADGIGIADEMDFVSAQGEFHAEFGGDDAAAAVRRITGDADTHSFSMHGKIGAGIAMQLKVPADLETLINKRLSSGSYNSVEDVLRHAHANRLGQSTLQSQNCRLAATPFLGCFLDARLKCAKACFDNNLDLATEYASGWSSSHVQNLTQPADDSIATDVVD